VTVETTPARTPFRIWGGVLAAAAAWVVLFAANEMVWDRLVFDWLGLEGHWAEALHFFLMDSVKIMLLLCGVIFVAAVLRTFISVERTRALLGGRRTLAGNAAAAGLGVATPFCSCSAVPVFIGFVSAGVPLGITMSFLIASPMVNEVAVVLIFGLFGFEVAAYYVLFGLAIAIGSGYVIGRLDLERWVEPFVYEVAAVPAAEGRRPTWQERLAVGRAEVRSIVGKIWPFLLAALAIGAAIHGWVPEDFFVRHAGSGQFWAVPLAVVMGIPLYSNVAGALPLVEAMTAKGLALGTALAFMMSVVALSFPEMILLRRVLRPRLLAVFIGVVGLGILATGYLFNAIL
jgi:uncharacterized membrane protein YraQ (UPF0718 family)